MNNTKDIQGTNETNWVPKRRDALDVTFEDFQASFKSKTTMDLIRAYFVFTFCSMDVIVDNNLKVG